MKKSIIVALIVTLIVGSVSFSGYQKIKNPVFQGDTSGMKCTLSWYFAAPTADVWILGDTTDAGMYVPEQVWEITDLKLSGNCDSGDTLCVNLWSANSSDNNNENILVPSDSIQGTSYNRIADMTSSLSSTYKWVTPGEGLGMELNFIAGTPTNVIVTLEYRRRIGDGGE